VSVTEWIVASEMPSATAVTVTVRGEAQSDVDVESNTTELGKMDTWAGLEAATDTVTLERGREPRTTE
jgi:hypothetical protein